MNYTELLHNLRIDPKYKPSNYTVNDLYHALPIISAVPLVKASNGLYSAELTLQPLLDDTDMIIKHPNGTVTSKQYLDMMVFLGEINRSKLVPSMAKNPTLGSLTPLGLYAYKLNYDIPYSAWDKTSKYISLYLGKFLKDIKDLDSVPQLTAEQIAEYRELMQTVKNSGELKPNTFYRSPLKEIEGVKIPPAAAYMMLQLWLANVEKRDTNSMILDPINWDNVPDSYDATMAPKTNRLADWV